MISIINIVYITILFVQTGMIKCIFMRSCVYNNILSLLVIIYFCLMVGIVYIINQCYIENEHSLYNTEWSYQLYC